MSMKITQEFMDDYVIKPIMKELDEIRKLIKSNDKSLTFKIGCMSENIARLPKRKR
jgi:hypothetical protein